MNQLLAVLLCLSTFSGFLQAATPSDASIKELLGLSGEDRKTEEPGIAQVEAMMDSLTKLFPGSAEISKDIQDKSRQEMQEMFASMKDTFPWKKIEELTIQSYRETFTQEEVDGLIAFYESPLGKAYVKKLPLINQKVMALMPQLMAPMLAPMVEKMTKSATADMKKMDAEMAKEKTQFELEEARNAAELKQIEADIARRKEKLKKRGIDFDQKEVAPPSKPPIDPPAGEKP